MGRVYCRVNAELEPGRRIVQTWRTTNFQADDPESRIEVILEPGTEGTPLILNHTMVPGDHDGYRDGGWEKSYFVSTKACRGG